MGKSRDGSRECNIVWRTLDAQFWGVPQRRRRIFLVVDYTRGCTEKILFKPESMRRNITESQGTWHKAGRQADTSAAETITFDMTHANDVIRENHGSVNTLQARMGTGGNQVPLVYSRPSYAEVKEDTTFVTLRASGGCNGGGSENLIYGEMLRKLTPLECERLQGLPDNWTLIDDKSCSDSARYKAIGNGMAQPCADFVIRRVAEFLRKSGKTGTKHGSGNHV